jgi:hypothetical protein
MSNLSNSAKLVGDRAFERLDLRAELAKLERMIEQLKVDYEQFFLGMVPHAPDQLHNQVKRAIRALIKAPFKSSQISFSLRTLESRYHTYNTYWSRVNRQRDDGTYHRDIFRANMRERAKAEEQLAQTAKGKAKNSMQALFQAYKGELERQTGTKQKLDYDAFERTLLKRAKDFKERHGNKKLAFKVMVQNGKVTVKAKVKER